MSHFIFYTYEGYTEGPNGKSIENCQLLGVAGGETVEGAFENLLKENLWISEYDFTIDSGNIIARELLNDKQYSF